MLLIRRFPRRLLLVSLRCSILFAALLPVLFSPLPLGPAALRCLARGVAPRLVTLGFVAPMVLRFVRVMFLKM
jgi:hypothetical protein